jgi:hypothetical protein
MTSVGYTKVMHRPEPRTRLSTEAPAPDRSPDLAAPGRSAVPPRSAAAPRSGAARRSPARTTSHPASPDLRIALRPRLRDRFAARLRAGRLDAALAAGVAPEEDPALALRAQRLTARRERSALAMSVLRSLDDARSSGGYLRVPVSRVQVREAEGELSLLAQRLSAPGPVAARGVALVRALLGDGLGPLYDDRSVQELGPVVRRAADALLLDG